MALQPGTAAEEFTRARAVFLVHGYLDTSLKMRPMASYLRRRGWTVYTPMMTPGNGSAGLDELAAQLGSTIDRECGPDQPFDLVGFSMGGIVCRYYAQKLAKRGRVRHLITISSPHHGTWTAYLSGKKGIRQMRPGSSLLNALNADTEALAHVKFTSLWTPLDLMIIPPSSSHMPFGKEELIWMPAHPLMVWNGASYRAVAAALRE